MAKGSFSTLLGLSFDDSKPEGGFWVAYSVGDSCLIQLRGQVVDTFPEIGSTDFGNSPNLIASNPLYNKELLNKVNVKAGEFNYGDNFYLMTDAIANWFITQLEEAKKPWLTLDEFLDHENEGLCDYITLLRDEGRLKNDDVTIARVTILEE